jgi:GNAT superfamily N-acetyltransferase
MWQDSGMIIRLGREDELAAFLALAGEVEQWFGPMVGVPGFHRAVEQHLRQGMALLAFDADASDAAQQPLGGLLFGAEPPVYHVHWMVVSDRSRGQGVGRSLLDEAVARFTSGPGTLEVVTFGADHPGAAESGARVFYERLGFTPAEPAEDGPEGGSRQVYRRPLPVQVPLPVSSPQPPSG